MYVVYGSILGNIDVTLAAAYYVCVCVFLINILPFS